MIWQKLRDHITDCYFCMVNIKGVGKKNQHKVSYPSIPSAMQSVPQCKELSVPVIGVFPS